MACEALNTFRRPFLFGKVDVLRFFADETVFYIAGWKMYNYGTYLINFLKYYLFCKDFISSIVLIVRGDKNGVFP
jgi:hypothetical protein